MSGKKDRGKNWPKNEKEPYLHPWLFFCVKYPAEYALQLKEVQGAPLPGWGLGAEGAGGRPSNNRHL